MEAIRALGATPVVVDGLDPAAVGQAVARAEPEAIIHEMTALSGSPDFRHFDSWFRVTNLLRTTGTKNLLSAATATGVTRFVAQSYADWNHRRNGDALLTEEDPLDPHPIASRRETVDAIRVLEDAVTGAPMVGIALRYGNLYGPGSSDAFLATLRERKLPVIGDGAGIWTNCHVDDAAGAAVAALESGTTGIYHIVDDEPAPVSEFLPAVAKIVGAKPPLHVPVWLGRLLAGEAAVHWMTAARGVSNAKAKRELGWRPFWPSWRDGFRLGLSAPIPYAAPARPGRRVVPA
jgi:nucleoside-diphosphate-sugar epimerase